MDRMSGFAQQNHSHLNSLQTFILINIHDYHGSADHANDEIILANDCVHYWLFQFL